ncbi:hypothetical protein [Longispora urticae]
MEITDLAVAASAVLATKAWESVSSRAGDSTWNTLTSLVQRIRLRFNGKQLQVLDAAQVSPADGVSRETLSKLLEEMVTADQRLRRDLEALLDRLHAEGAATLGINIGPGSTVHKAVSIGTVNGNVTI